jgi:hypothetical protein
VTAQSARLAVVGKIRRINIEVAMKRDVVILDVTPPGSYHLTYRVWAERGSLEGFSPGEFLQVEGNVTRAAGDAFDTIHAEIARTPPA